MYYQFNNNIGCIETTAFKHNIWSAQQAQNQSFNTSYVVIKHELDARGGTRYVFQYILCSRV